MSNFQITVEGADEIVQKFQDFIKTENFESALEKASLLVESRAKQNVPVNTGALRRSIASKVENSGDTYTGVVYTPLEYAPYIEFGTGLFAESGGRADVPWCYQDDKGNWHSTSGQKPQPYMRPALNDSREEIIEIIKEAFNND